MAKEFKTLEEAIKAYTEIEGKLSAEVEAHKITKKNLADAESIAKDAVDKANEALANQKDEGVIVAVKGKKYRINFGVDGLTKEELKGNAAALEKLIKKGSSALTAI